MAKKREWINLEEIEKLAQLGLTQGEIAGCLGVCRETWHVEIARGRTDISDAYNRGKCAHARLIIGKLAKIASEGNPQALIFLAKAHLNRRENINLLIQGDEDAPIQINAKVEVTNMDDEQRKSRIGELEAKRKARKDAEDES